jgi:protein-S-isoprenylcysteine O-methyltransferase Ste14
VRDLLFLTRVSDLYALHVLFWGVFVARILFGFFSRARIAAGPRAEVPRAAPGASLLIGFHTLAVGLMYLALGLGLSGGGAAMLFAPKPLVGAAIVLSATGLAAWALLWFRSWRMSARLDRGHELATGGPFALIRHPIYTSVNLVALGTFLWVPSWPVLAAVILVVIGSDLRARAEERLLVEAFGDQYRVFMHGRRRFLPFVY